LLGRPHQSKLWPSVRKIVVRPFANVLHLVRSLRRALREPEVKGVFTIAFTLIAIATIFYWLVEGWTLLDAFYFAIVTIATVGYGDITPKTAVGKIFTMGYIVAGIGIFVAAVTAFSQATIRGERPPKD
jgi:voltage-gated potassium channel